MGTVWVARNAAIGGAEVAVKVLHPNLADDKRSVARFRNEALIAARIGHPSIVRVFDFGESDDAAPFMVMERLHGESLAERLEREGSLPMREAVDLVRAVLEALEAAHEKDVLHRDLKPENIFLAREGDTVVPKILDFGVSKILGDDARRTRMTRTGALLGTPAYMSPEQVMGTVVDLRSDVWAMGVILYELLTGRLPFDAPNYNAVLVRIATGRGDSITQHLPDLDGGLASIVERAMARTAAQRFGSAREMRDTLDAWTRGEVKAPRAAPRRISTDPIRDTPFAFEHHDTLPDDGRSLRPAVTRASRLWALAVTLTAALALTMVAWNPFRRADTHASTAHVAMTVPATSPAMLRIEGLPPGAHVHVDGAPVMLPTQLARGVNHSVRVSAAGYRDWMQVVPEPARDVTLTWAGEAVPSLVETVPVNGNTVADASVVLPMRRTAHTTTRRPSGHGANARGVPNSLVGGDLPY